MHALKARPWSVRLRLPDYGMGDIPVEQRSPSPEPIFDKNGQRVNSRLVLRRQKLERYVRRVNALLFSGRLHSAAGWPGEQRIYS